MQKSIEIHQNFLQYKVLGRGASLAVARARSKVGRAPRFTTPRS